MSIPVWELGSVVVGACWILVALVWSAGFVVNLLSAPPVTRRRNWWVGWVALVALMVVVIRRFIPSAVWRALTYRAAWLDIVGVVVLLSGTAFTLWARLHLGKMWTGTVTIKKDHQLHTDGPYAITRHPIYTGLLVMLGGTAMIEGLGPWLILFVLVSLFMLLKIRSEEMLLSAEFSGDYAAYKATVPRLIPRLTTRGRNTTL